jgi:biotin operon repressor
MEDLITILSDGMFHSGEDLGKKLDIYKSGCLEKNMSKIRTLGIPFRVKKRPRAIE